MASLGAISRSLSSKSSDTSEKSLGNPPEIPHATAGGGALRIDEVDSRIINKKNIREEGPVEGEDDPHAKKRCLNRLSCLQSKILEGFFSMCAHPVEAQRKELSEATGLTENQVKYWFQNKRTHVKHVSGKEENYRLRMENEILKDENNKIKQAKGNMFCPSCTEDPRKIQIIKEFERLQAQNQWMQEELARLYSELRRSALARGRPFHLIESSSETVFVPNDDARMLAGIARNAVHEFVTLANSSGAVWLPVAAGSLETLNKMAYLQAFPGHSYAIGLKMEATRADAVVMMESKTVVEFLMNSENYESFFPGIMSHATTTKLYNWPSHPQGDYDGALELVRVEVVFPSPLVPARKHAFLRYCKKIDHETTAIVDITVEGSEGSFFKCRKMGSGVLIRSIRPTSCKVTVIEHVRVDNAGIHDIFKACRSGLLFGARRWVMSMARQGARMRDVFHVTNSSMTVSTKGRKIIMQMADNLLAHYACSIASVPADAWTLQCGHGTEEDVKVTYMRTDNNKAIVCASASFLLPVPMRRVFDLLRNNMLRVKWDFLMNVGSIKEEAHVANGIGSDDSVSILHVKHDAVGKDTTMILQNCSYDASGSFLVYSALDNQVVDVIMSPGEDQEMPSVPMFPHGFYLVPVADPAQPNSTIGETGGIVMTTGFQVPMKMARGTGLSPRPVSSVIKILADQIKNVKDMLLCSHPIFYRKV